MSVRARFKRRRAVALLMLLAALKETSGRQHGAEEKHAAGSSRP